MKKFESPADTAGGFFSSSDYQELTDHLNKLGREGWEVVSVVDTIFTHNQVHGLLFTLKLEIGQ